MIKCNSVSKYFGTQVVIDQLSYEFTDKGFYLLYGESGSGKTTFFNILCGFQTFEGGSVSIDNKEYTYLVDSDNMNNIMDYIVQDTIYVEFLTVMDNLKLVCNDSELINKTLIRFGLNGKENQYPSTLSGGEKQRFAIVRALLGKKKILFLDEPTASLDNEAKREVFEYLKMIKDEVLVICSSHDAAAKEYADEVIEFKKNSIMCKSCRNVQKINHKKVRFERVEKKDPSKDYSYIKKWFSSKRRNKVANLLFGIFLTIAICMCMIADTPDKKYESNLEHMYRINQCQIEVHNDKFVRYKELCQVKGISEVVIPYDSCLPDVEIDKNSIMQEIPDYDVDLSTLPYSREAFHLSDKILYGSYFTDEKQIILSYDVAINMNKEHPEALIGTKITKNIYRFGRVEFEIVGILDKFSEIDRSYFNAINVDNGAGIFINGKFTKRYVEVKESMETEYKRYNLYFNTYKDMKNFNSSNSEEFIFYPMVPKTKDVFETMYNIMFPLSIFIALFTILFYINLIKTEIAYNNGFVSVFEYSGYRKKKVISYFVWINFCYMLRTCLIAVVLAFGITFILNKINIKFGIFGFQLFTYNFPLIIAFVLGIVLISLVVINILLRRVKLSSWYENVIAQRDLL